MIGHAASPQSGPTEPVHQPHPRGYRDEDRRHRALRDLLDGQRRRLSGGTERGQPVPPEGSRRGLGTGRLARHGFRARRHGSLDRPLRPADRAPDLLRQRHPPRRARVPLRLASRRREAPRLRRDVRPAARGRRRAWHRQDQGRRRRLRGGRAGHPGDARRLRQALRAGGAARHRHRHRVPAVRQHQHHRPRARRSSMGSA